MSKVLVVDDSAVIRNMIGQYLRSKGHEVVEAEDGTFGIEAFKRHRDIELILTDVNMPNMDGIEMCAAIREIEGMRPVIFALTTESNMGLRESGKKVGISGWVLKPFSETKIDLVLQTFQKLLAKSS